MIFVIFSNKRQNFTNILQTRQFVRSPASVTEVNIIGYICEYLHFAGRSSPCIVVTVSPYFTSCSLCILYIIFQPKTRVFSKFLCIFKDVCTGYQKEIVPI